jgi:hypothetical protein
MKKAKSGERLTRRGMFQAGAAALTTAATLAAAEAQQAAPVRSPNHNLPNETVPGAKNSVLVRYRIYVCLERLPSNTFEDADFDDVDRLES